jgi:hypothetical protein
MIHRKVLDVEQCIRRLRSANDVPLLSRLALGHLS